MAADIPWRCWRRGWHAGSGRAPAVHCGTDALKPRWVTDGCSTGLRGAEQTGLWETSCKQNEHDGQWKWQMFTICWRYVMTASNKTSSAYRKIELILSTVIRERSSAEPSRVRRQLMACLATNRPAGGWRSEAGQRGFSQSWEEQNLMHSSKTLF